jgi:hypothetical protein
VIDQKLAVLSTLGALSTANAVGSAAETVGVKMAERVEKLISDEGDRALCSANVAWTLTVNDTMIAALLDVVCQWATKFKNVAASSPLQRIFAAGLSSKRPASATKQLYLKAMLNTYSGACDALEPHIQV